MAKDKCFRVFKEAVASQDKLKQRGRTKDLVCATKNSNVLSHKNKVTYTLHKCPIIRIDKKKKLAKLNTCGWKTPTTKSHLNGVLSEFGNKKIVQKKKQWTVNGEQFQDGMTIKI